MDALQVDLLRVERSIRMIRHDKVILDEAIPPVGGFSCVGWGRVKVRT